jgi:hypothetical protein
MIEPKDITKMVTHIVRRDSGKSDATIMHPMREWTLGLFVVGMLVLCGVIFTITLYRMYSSSLETAVPVVVTTIPYTEPLVIETIHYYEKEQTNYHAMLGVESVSGVKMLSIPATTQATTSSIIQPLVTPAATNTPLVTPKPPLPVKESSDPVIPTPAL